MTIESVAPLQNSTALSSQVSKHHLMLICQTASILLTSDFLWADSLPPDLHRLFRGEWISEICALTSDICALATVAISRISPILSYVQINLHAPRARQHYRRAGGCAFFESLIRIQAVVRHYLFKSSGTKSCQWRRRDAALARL